MDCPLRPGIEKKHPPLRKTTARKSLRLVIEKNVNKRFKTIQWIMDQKAKVKPLDESVEDFPLKKNSVAIFCLSVSVKRGELFTKFIT